MVFCHRPDPETPMEEIARAWDWVIRKGWASYWGTSEWSAYDIAEAHYVCEKYNLVKPVVEQPQYNILVRDKMEVDYRRLFEEKKLGTTVWSPLASGLLTGKYNDGIPKGSRFETNPDLAGFLSLYFGDNKDKTVEKLKKFGDLAKDLGVPMVQLAMAWVINNPDVSTAITGASNTKQLEETLQAITIRKKITPEIEKKI